MLYRKLEKDFTFKDARGSLDQLVHDGYKQINVLVTKSGVTRGGHYHKKCTEAFYLIEGTVEVELRRYKDSLDERERVQFGAGDFFEIAPYIVHSMYFPLDCVMVQMYDVPVESESGEKDIYTE